jgi:hypothetical protein
MNEFEREVRRLRYLRHVEPSELEIKFPAIAWREPLRVEPMPRYACRLCVGLSGLGEVRFESLAETPEEVLRHLATCHPKR